MTDLTLVELFAGIGGFSAGFERAGVKTVAAVEIDQAARRVFSRHFPEAAMFDDVTKVGGDDLRSVGFIPERGILTGGWPCQDISLAGQRSGLDGERSGLFSEVVRLLTELQPRWFVLENVPNLLSINGGRDMGAVVGALAECGYGLSWRVCDASGFGVPQRRRRIFFVGHFGDGGGECSAQVLFESEGVCGDIAAGREAGPESSCEVAGCAGTRCGGGRDVVDVSNTHTHIDVAGRRETRISDRRRSGSRRAPNCVGTITSSALMYGADENTAQAGHLIVQRNTDRPLREINELNA